MLLFPVIQIVHAEERNRSSIISLDVYLSRQRSIVLELQVASLLLSKYDIAEVDLVVLDTDEGLLAGADQWDVDLASLREDWEKRVDVAVELRGERDCDCRAETS